jgi:hypothetical protein
MAVLGLFLLAGASAGPTLVGRDDGLQADRVGAPTGRGGHRGVRVSVGRVLRTCGGIGLGWGRVLRGGRRVAAGECGGRGGEVGEGGGDGMDELFDVVGGKEARAAVGLAGPPVWVCLGDDLDDVVLVEREILGFLSWVGRPSESVGRCERE